MSSFIKANLVSINKIDVNIFTSLNRPTTDSFHIYINELEYKNFKIVKSVSMASNYFYSIELDEPYQFGKEYVLFISGYEKVVVSTFNATEFKEFDELFNYDGPLGSFYCKKETSFYIWAPLATSVMLLLEKDGRFMNIPMKRIKNGVFSHTEKGDLVDCRYIYKVKNSGVELTTLDPYGVGVTLNSEYNSIIDLNSIKNIKKEVPTYPINKLSDCIIYEANVRDFTEGNGTNIKEKGKYLGLIEENRTTKGNHYAGLDYLKYLGITHLQLNPVTDFYGVDDIKCKNYNWGYDVTSFFALEGSYSSNPFNSASRLIEFKTMVETLHKNNIRVVLDVVYNHIYKYETSCFEKTVPNYFFRKKKNGEYSNASGCGNDFASEKYMARRIILESLKYFTEIFNIDGYRFDLMGLIDINTINKAYQELKNIKSDIVMYGEGWDMGLELPKNQKASFLNAAKMPNIGFFNDAYRDFIKGQSFNSALHVKGYLCGDTSYVNGVDYALFGSVINNSYGPRFISASQSINFIECHDNFTVFDKLMVSNAEEDEHMILNRCQLGIGLLMVSFGVPFIHMGQEIGLSKHGLGNSYNVPKVNNMDWKLVDKRYDLVIYMHHVAKLRKYKLRLFSNDDPNIIKNIFTYSHWNNGMYCLYSYNKEYLDEYNKIFILINPTNSNQIYELDDYYTYLSSPDKPDKAVEIHIKNGLIPPCSMQILYK